MRVLAAWLAVSCGSDPPPARDPGDNPGIGFDGGAAGEGGSGTCPSAPPKIGERCTDFESSACEFPDGDCVTSGGVMYTMTAVYCCPDGFWDICSRRSPCDEFLTDAGPAPTPPDAGAPDVPRTPDGGGDAPAPPDAAVDASPDAELDASPDLAPDSAPDLEPDAGDDASTDV